MKTDTMREFDEKFGYTDTLETGKSVRRIKGILLVSTVTDWINTRLIDKKVVEEKFKEHLRSNTYDGNESLVFKTTVKEIQSLLNK